MDAGVRGKLGKLTEEAQKNVLNTNGGLDKDAAEHLLAVFADVSEEEQVGTKIRLSASLRRSSFPPSSLFQAELLEAMEGMDNEQKTAFLATLASSSTTERKGLLEKISSMTVEESSAYYEALSSVSGVLAEGSDAERKELMGALASMSEVEQQAFVAKLGAMDAEERKTMLEEMAEMDSTQKAGLLAVISDSHASNIAMEDFKKRNPAVLNNVSGSALAAAGMTEKQAAKAEMALTKALVGLSEEEQKATKELLAGMDDDQKAAFLAAIGGATAEEAAAMLTMVSQLAPEARDALMTTMMGGGSGEAANMLLAVTRQRISSDAAQDRFRVRMTQLLNTMGGKDKDARDEFIQNLSKRKRADREHLMKMLANSHSPFPQGSYGRTVHNKTVDRVLSEDPDLAPPTRSRSQTTPVRSHAQWSPNQSESGHIMRGPRQTEPTLLMKQTSHTCYSFIPRQRTIEKGPAKAWSSEAPHANASWQGQGSTGRSSNDGFSTSMQSGSRSRPTSSAREKELRVKQLRETRERQHRQQNTARSAAREIRGARRGSADSDNLEFQQMDPHRGGARQRRQSGTHGSQSPPSATYPGVLSPPQPQATNRILPPLLDSPLLSPAHRGNPRRSEPELSVNLNTFNKRESRSGDTTAKSRSNNGVVNALVDGMATSSSERRRRAPGLAQMQLEDRANAHEKRGSGWVGGGLMAPYWQGK
jgi:hypothetical protein